MIKILGTGSYLPEKIMTNHDLAKIVDTSDEWISKRTGIKERRIASDNEATSDLAVKASEKALEMAGLKPQDIELIIVGTSTADYSIPACAPIVQAKLGCGKIPAFDINSVCTSFSYAFMSAYSILSTGFYNNCLIVGADTYSRILNWKDRNTCVIFGDGAGAAVIKKDPSKKGILSYIFGADGKDADLIRIPVGGSKYPGQDPSIYKYDDLYFQMEGKKVYEFTINVIPDVAERLVKQANLTSNDVDWIVLHQANYRIIEAVAKKLELPLDKFIVNIDKVGNTSSGSIPIALDEAVRSGKIKEGNKVMAIGFGGGLSWGGFIVEW
ncbi:MAG: 3-oxoacyl-ACP synthase [Spirochaetes bacterium GWD1_27_9]|nr:MAG: 3-oxoacyl-ACP synthase [Spirochaetes bacterium GWB1_27_13]OHD21966.1 MAG: 3-oxoacyl-ACP synthase [Spirochaetes bacterium GWC1_27_15]OHD43593.1 MAG: 3-oxoacyl-ACP synthase [Spirochaetes bacterium GWD1_27_9]